jgi:glycosyltransferase involved in cell wall biosynthesis
MKILYHHRTLGDGAEGIHVSVMVEAFRALGHEVRVAAVIGEQTNVSTPRTRMLNSLAQWTPRLTYEAMELGYSLAGYRMLRRHMESWKPDVLYERYMLFNNAGWAAAWRTGIPLVLEVNAPLAYERAAYERLSLRRIARLCERFVCSRADLIIVVSSPLRDYLVAQGIPAERIAVMPNGVEPEVFRPDAHTRHELRTRLQIPRETIVVGFVGSLRSWHGVDLLLEAVARVGTSRKGVHILIVGDGPCRTDLERLVSSRGLEGSVTFTGRVPHGDMPQYVAALDIGVSPRTTFYASPMKVLEYMAAGLAVVAPRLPNLQDLITDGVNGVLFQPENIDDLSATLFSLICDAQRREQLGQSARAIVLGGRTWRHNAARVIELVEKGQR